MCLLWARGCGLSGAVAAGTRRAVRGQAVCRAGAPIVWTGTPRLIDQGDNMFNWITREFRRVFGKDPYYRTIHSLRGFTPDNDEL